jgi:hypothetical protein
MRRLGGQLAMPSHSAPPLEPRPLPYTVLREGREALPVFKAALRCNLWGQQSIVFPFDHGITFARSLL